MNEYLKMLKEDSIMNQEMVESLDEELIELSERENARFQMQKEIMESIGKEKKMG